MSWRFISILAIALSACGGEPKAADPAAATPGEPAPGANLSSPEHCTALGNGCARGGYQMCCQGGHCSFTFADGARFTSLEDALAYCGAGDAGTFIPAPNPGAGNADGGTVGAFDGGSSGGANNSSGGSGGSGGTGGTGGTGGSGGSSGSTGACYGSPSSCASEYGPSNCSSNPGCYYQYEQCFGVSSSCQSFYSPSSCGYQLGCYWDDTDQQCLGAAVSCGSRTSRGGCYSLNGCNWRDAVCLGSAYPCSDYSESSCNATSGCYWR